jgi:hypothetical protein
VCKSSHVFSFEVLRPVTFLEFTRLGGGAEHCFSAFKFHTAWGPDLALKFFGSHRMHLMMFAQPLYGFTYLLADASQRRSAAG